MCVARRNGTRVPKQNRDRRAAFHVWHPGAIQKGLRRSKKVLGLCENSYVEVLRMSPVLHRAGSITVPPTYSSGFSEVTLLFLPIRTSCPSLLSFFAKHEKKANQIQTSSTDRTSSTAIFSFFKKHQKTSNDSEDRGGGGGKSEKRCGSHVVLSCSTYYQRDVSPEE